MKANEGEERWRGNANLETVVTQPDLYIISIPENNTQSSRGGFKSLKPKTGYANGREKRN